ncbi:MAG: GDP-mannose 4,6-dehydratase, partial [Chlamydiota bacterium]|nr:GDP-mannose 4,6-dehydratase [Chlamydiota bacterium]
QSLNLRNKDSINNIIAKTQPDLIYHLAGIAFVPACEKDQTLAQDVNVNGFKNILLQISKSSLKTKVIAISTSQVYDTRTSSHDALTEDSPVHPLSVYAQTKLEMEQKAKHLAETLDLDIVIMRPFNHIGPGQHENFVVGSFAKQIADISANKSEAVLNVGDLTARRDFTDVRDIVKGYILAARHAKANTTYNLCSGTTYSIQEILNKMLSFIDVKVDVRVDQERLRKNDMPVIYGSFNKFHHDTGWSPQIPLEKTLQDALHYWLNQHE